MGTFRFAPVVLTLACLAACSGPSGGTGGGGGFAGGFGGGGFGGSGGFGGGGTGGGGSAGGGTGGGATGGGTGGGAATGAFNTDNTVQLSTPQLARDSAGKLYLLAASPTPTAPGKSVVLYGECAAGCGSASGWSVTQVDDSGALNDQVKLAVEGNGTVHLVELLTATNAVRYAVCAGNCLSISSWTSVDVGLPSSYSNPSLPAGRDLAVSAAGKPRLLLNAYAGSGPQVHLLACDGTCSDGSGWQVGPLVNATAVAGSVTSTEQLVVATDQSFSLVYAECATGCGAPGQWAVSPLTSANTNSISLVNANGALHLAFMSSLTVASDQTLYATCAAQCGQAANWAVTEAQAGEGGRGGVDLAVSSTGTIAIATASVINDHQTLSWAHCAGNCTQAGSWSTTPLETGAQVFDPPVPEAGAACSNPTPFWSVGSFVQLVANAQGGFQLAYDASSYDQCIGSSTTSYLRGSVIRLNGQPAP